MFGQKNGDTDHIKHVFFILFDCKKELMADYVHLLKCHFNLTQPTKCFSAQIKPELLQYSQYIVLYPI